MRAHIRPSLVMLTLFTALTGIAYPLLVTAVAQVARPLQANGSIVLRDGKPVGSELIGQAFTGARYFHPRPSATSGPDPKDDTKTVDAPYNAASSTGSNLGPTSKKLIDRVKADADALRAGSGVAVLPADSVTTSASGLDPHISPGFAQVQAARVATARGLPLARVQQLLEAYTLLPTLRFIGEPRVNVLLLNLALDRLPASG
jgi:potassium-transporting ATPase KdpC subunit